MAIKFSYLKSLLTAVSAPALALAAGTAFSESDENLILGNTDNNETVSLDSEKDDISAAEMIKFAHFEQVEPASIYDLYFRHAEVARDIHTQAIGEFTGHKDIEVDLIRRDPNVPDTETFDIMSNYSSISVSSGLTSFGEDLHEGITDSFKQAMERFELSMPALIIAAGNDASDDIFRDGLRLSDITRNGLAVGETQALENEFVIESHSSFKPNIAAENPFDTKQYHYIEMAPDLNGQEDFVEDYLFRRNVLEALEQANITDTSSPEFESFRNNARTDQYLIELATKKEASDVISNPSEFHQWIHDDIRRGYGFEYGDDGHLTAIDGTSFSAPHLAGHVSGAILLEEERRYNDLPSLTTEEIMTIVKLSTVQVANRESSHDDLTHTMHNYSNDANQIFTTHGGHGVFSSEKFKQLLDEAHHVIERTPDIDRTNIEHQLDGVVNGSHNFSFQLPHNEEGLIFDKMVLSYEIEGLGQVGALMLSKGGETPKRLGPEGNDGFQWVTTDRYFGEKMSSGQTWSLEALTYQNTGQITDPSLTLFAYNENSLMGQMIARHADNPVLQKELSLQSDFAKGALSKDSLGVYEQMYMDITHPGVAAP